jgi:hypothetical protein
VSADAEAARPEWLAREASFAELAEYLHGQLSVSSRGESSLELVFDEHGVFRRCHLKVNLHPAELEQRRAEITAYRHAAETAAYETRPIGPLQTRRKHA